MNKFSDWIKRWTPQDDGEFVAVFCVFLGVCMVGLLILLAADCLFDFEINFCNIPK